MALEVLLHNTPSALFSTREVRQPGCSLLFWRVEGNLLYYGDNFAPTAAVLWLRIRVAIALARLQLGRLEAS